jgi:hypothetical protein
MNVLFLVSRDYYEQKMSRCRFHQMAAVGRVPGVTVQIWGRGFPDYAPDATLWDNIQRVFGATAFDLVHVYKPGDHQDVAGCPVPKSIDYNEAWDIPWVVKEVTRNDIRLVIFHHHNDWQALRSHPRLYRRRLLTHVPHGAERAIFAPVAQPWEARSVPILLTGALKARHYPLRVRCAELIQAGRLPGEVRSHPGYRTSGVKETEAQFADYARHLGRSRIALVLGITHQYALAKYPEAAMAGCLLIGDIPPELEPTLGQYMVRLTPAMSDDDIVAQVGWWLEHDEAAQARAAASQQLALEQFTMEHYAAQFVQVARRFLEQTGPYRSGRWGWDRIGQASRAVKAWLTRRAPRQTDGVISRAQH